MNKDEKERAGPMSDTPVRLHGNDIILTKEPGRAYRVDSGCVLVFILPLREDTPGRRFFLAEVGPGGSIPPLFYRSAQADEDCTWVFGLSPLEESQLTPIEPSAEIRQAFAQKAGLRDVDIIGFEESAVESYRLEAMRDQRNLFATGEERRSTYSRGLELIYRLFRNSRVERRQRHQPTGHHLYDAAARLCDWQGIEPVGLDVVRSNCGRRFTAQDLARLSGFICREVILEKDWYKRDSGPVLAFRNDGQAPVVCLPKKPGKYIIWDPVKNASVPLTRKEAAALDPRALLFYRPFPREKMNVKKLIRFALRDLYWRDLAYVLCFSLLVTLIGLLIPYLNEQLYDLFIPLGDIAGLRGVCAVVLACTLGNVSFTVVQNLFNFRALNRMKYSVQAAVFDRLFNLPESFFRAYESGDLGMRVIGISQLFTQLSTAVVKTSLVALFSLLYLWRMFKYSSDLGKIALVMLGCGMAIILFIGWRELKHERRQADIDSEVYSMMFQFLSGVSKLRIAGAENRALFEYLRRYTESRSLDMRKERYGVTLNVLTGAMSTIFSMVFFYIFIHRGLDLSVGSFMGFTAAFGSFSQAMIQLVSSFLEVNSVIPGYDQIRPILETLPEQQEDAGMPGELFGEIEANNLTFAYDPESPPVIQDLSFHIKPGEYVGIVGSSGCGKSTLLKLLLGFEKPQSGRVYYDGRDIDAIDKRELRKRFGVVLQNGGLITGSIHDNITITTPSATLDQVKQAVRDAGLEKDIEEMPMGLHTILSEGDGSISGGQRQRVLIARAIVSKPKILFFDEATSALDNATQAAVGESLERLNSTRIIIAHRLSTIIRCDRILVMDAGRLVEEGNFEQLMAKKGLFYQLASRQLA